MWWSLIVHSEQDAQPEVIFDQDKRATTTADFLPQNARSKPGLLHPQAVDSSAPSCTSFESPKYSLFTFLAKRGVSFGRCESGS